MTTPQERAGSYLNVAPLLRPQSITIVGASERTGSWSHRIFDNLRSYGFPGEVYLVNPRHRELYGARCFASVSDVPGKPDQLVVIVPAQQVAGVIEEAGSRGCRSAVVFSGGFSETNTPAGIAAEAELIRAARRHGIVIGGPNCLGNISTRERVLTLAELGVELFQAGGLALISQSSGLMGGVARYAHSRAIGLSYGIASGSEADLDAADYLNYLVQDEATRVVGLLLEAIRRPAEFALACERALAVKKPILVLKIGKSKKGQAAALSHTGALAGSYQGFKAFCRRYGLIEVGGLDELVNTAEIFLRSCLPTAGGVAALALSGGARGYLHDLGEELAIDFPEPGAAIRRPLERLLGVGAEAGNPLDLGAAGASNPEVQLQCLDLLAGQPGIGLVAVQGDPPQGERFAARAAGYQKMIERSAQLAKPIIFFSRASYPVSNYGMEFRARCGAPFLQEIRMSFQAISHVMAYQKKLASRPREIRREENFIEKSPRFPPGRGRSVTVALPDEEAFALLEQAGIPVARYETCRSLEAAQQAAQNIGYPVALKASAQGLTHKVESGGVALGLAGPAEVAGAFVSVTEKTAEFIKSPIRVLVQEMIRGPLELYVGGRSDPEFGPLVLFGFGGVFVEALGRVSTRLAPVEVYEAEEMIAESGVGRALSRLGMNRPNSAASIMDIIVRMSELIAGPAEIDTIEINPFFFCGQDRQCVGVDVVALKRL